MVFDTVRSPTVCIFEWKSQCRLAAQPFVCDCQHEAPRVKISIELILVDEAESFQDAWAPVSAVASFKCIFEMVFDTLRSPRFCIFLGQNPPPPPPPPSPLPPLTPPPHTRLARKFFQRERPARILYMYTQKTEKTTVCLFPRPKTPHAHTHTHTHTKHTHTHTHTHALTTTEMQGYSTAQHIIDFHVGAISTGA